MVKPKRDLAEDFAPRQAQQPSMREALQPGDVTDPLKHLTVQMPESLRRRVKAAAVEEGTSVRDLVTTAIETHLKTLGR